jgi:outer membrane receptor protein involved in Fe transport
MASVRVSLAYISVIALAFTSLRVQAADPPPPSAATPAGSTDSNGSVSIDLDVVAKNLDAARQQIQPSLGASVYNFSPEALQTVPQGENAPLNQVLLQAPGVVQDSFGQIHLRGEHANVQYRLNGVELPEGLQVFGQALDSRFAQSMSLITGALPAQYGFQTAGVVDVQTKTGSTNPGFEMTMYGGQQGWLQPSISDGGRDGPVDWFVTSDFLHNNIGIENPTASYNVIHDTTNQFHGLAYVSGIIDPNTRISLILGGFTGQFQIPNNPNQPTLGFSVNGVSNFNSAQLNETQQESTQFAILSLQKHVDNIDVQISAFSRRSTLDFSPDWLGDLLFNGIAQQASRVDLANGVQADGSWRVDDNHTLRAGFTVQAEQATANSLSSVLPVDATGTPTTDQPFLVNNGLYSIGELYGVYVQDEWHILPKVTLNYGLRFDAVEEFTHESQVSPRINLVWQPTSDTTLHAGYSRYFVPPPYEALTPGTIASFLNTTAAPAVTQDSVVRAERSNYFDAGVSQVILPGLTVGIDYYYKQSTNLIDEGQFGAPIILTAFNYANGLQTGVQGTASYDSGPWSLYANAAWSRAMGRDINSAQFNFSPSELAFITDNYIHLDHDQTWTGSAGAAYTLNKGTDHPTLFSADMLVQSGLRASTATIPNGVALPTYATANLSIVQKLNLGVGRGTEIRLDLLNVGNASYQIRNGTGVGVGAPQYGMRRTLLAGLTQRF